MRKDSGEADLAFKKEHVVDIGALAQAPLCPADHSETSLCDYITIANRLQPKRGSTKHGAGRSAKKCGRPKASKDNFCSSASEPKFWIEFKSREETGECQGCIGSPQGRPQGRRYRHAQYICRISWPLRGRVTRRRPSGLISPNLQDWIQMRFQVHTESAPDSLFKTCGWFQWFLNIFSCTPGSKWLKVTSHPSLSQKLPGEKRGGPGKHHSVPFFQGNCGWFTGKVDEVNSNFFSREPQRSQCCPWSFCNVHSRLFFCQQQKSLMLHGRCTWVPNFFSAPRGGPLVGINGVIIPINASYNPL